ncbi:hypothetical protein [Paludisphaera rhizosphaerae]|uniref:hypothetical protein n=1 Tax=Paludisphaera rhizosphaerae TaxID=2711216 RepID=UPI0013E9D225|nr:hypothetical protein [Paludisphaera rhizosphaerae]
MSDRPAIIAKSAEEMHWWKTIRVDVTQTIERSSASLDKFAGVTLAKQTDYHYTETAAGERRLSLVMTLVDGTVSRKEQYFDGRKGTTIQYDKDHPEKQTAARTGKTFGSEASIPGADRPIPLKYQYVGNIPLHEALEKAQDLGEAEIDAKPCDKFMFNDVLLGQVRQNLLYFLRRDDALPVRVESYDGPDPATAHRLWIWESQKVDVVQGHPFVVKSELTQFNRDGDVRMTTHSEVTHVAFNEKVGSETFRPSISPNVEVSDAATGKILTPARKEADAVPKAPEAVPKTSEATGVVEVAEPPVGWDPVLVYSCWGLGVALLAAGLALKIRR